MGRTESLNLKNDYERACGWYGHFNKSEMALFSECTDRYAQKLLDTADIVRDAIFRQVASRTILPTGHRAATLGSAYDSIGDHHEQDDSQVFECFCIDPCIVADWKSAPCK